MHFVAGSNLFRQWLSDDTIFFGFRSICDDSNISSAELVQINWYYNIIKGEKAFYISGFTNSDERILEIPLPKDCNFSDVLVLGNDYEIIVVDKIKRKLWILNIENPNEVKCINLNTEVPIDHLDNHKKFDDYVLKISMNNDCFLCLTEGGHVSWGILPNFICKEKCIGKIIDVQCGFEHCIILTDMGRVYTWGNGRRLQLGHGDVNNLDEPEQVEALAGIKIIKISAGGWHSFALSEFGDLYAWGWNNHGQLGINESNDFSIPTLVDLFDGETQIEINVKDVACGTKHSAILLEDNSVWTCGNNNYGQLGLPQINEISVTSFKKVHQCNNNAKLICGPWTTVIIVND